jgi:predicted GTPase
MPCRLYHGPMRELIAGEGGSVLVLGASSPDAVALACEDLGEATSTPSGVTVYPTAALPDDLEIDTVRLVACERSTGVGVRTWAAGRGIPVADADLPRRRPRGGIRVVAVSAPSTGAGKTALTRRVARTLARSGVDVAVVRHPIASLLHWDRFDVAVVRTPPEVSAPRPLDEREELAPVVGTGVHVVTGLDPSRLVDVAAREAGPNGVIVWDGGGAAEPWLEPDLHLVVVDLLRDLPLARTGGASCVVLTKADSVSSERARDVEAAVRAVAGDVPVVLADLAVGVQPVNVLADKRVVIVEDARSLMLGGLAAGAGAVAAKRFRCGVVDPRPFAVGAIARALRDHPHVGAVIPSLGRTRDEIDDLAATVLATPGDAVLWASNADPAFVVPDERRPIVRAYGELTEVAGPPLQEVLASMVPGHG